MHRRPAPKPPARSGSSLSRVLTLVVLFLVGLIGAVTWSFIKNRSGHVVQDPPTRRQRLPVPDPDHEDHTTGAVKNVADIAAPDENARRATHAPPVFFGKAGKVVYPKHLPTPAPLHAADGDHHAQREDDFRGVECPPYDAHIEALQIPLKHLPRKKPTSVAAKYDRRSDKCATDGIWNRVRIADHHKILHHIVRLAQIQRNSFVLDWGSGCGHSLQFLTDEFNVHGVGIDVSNKTVEYAQHNTTKRNKHCVADGSRLQFLPSETFDHVLSFGSIYHVYNRTLFCHVLRLLVRVVKVGGTIYNGWTENGEFNRKHVALCLRDLPVVFKIHEEAVEFKDVAVFPLKAQQTSPNTYSLVITKGSVLPRDLAAAVDNLDAIPIECGVHQCDVRGSGVALRDTPKPTKHDPFAAQAAEQTPQTPAPPTKKKTVAPTEAPVIETDAPVTEAPEPPPTTEQASPSQDEVTTTDAPAAANDDEATPKPAKKKTNKKKKNKRQQEGASDETTTDAADGVETASAKTKKPKKDKKPKKAVKVLDDAAEEHITTRVDDVKTEAPTDAESPVAVDPSVEAAPWGSLTCPPYDPRIEELQIPLKHLPRKQKTSVAQKYDRRANNCLTNGIWHKVTLQDHRSILERIAVLLKIPKLAKAQDGDLKSASAAPLSVFDWGSGCGHKLTFLAKEYGTRGFGIDVSNKTVEYARENTTKKNNYCVADGTRLEWIPSDTFDRAFSFGSVYHVYNKDKFCHVLREMVRVVKPGGIVYNGWTENSEYKRAALNGCLTEGSWMEGAERNVVQILEEKDLFQGITTFPLKEHQEVPNTYSVVVVKAPTND